MDDPVPLVPAALVPLPHPHLPTYAILVKRCGRLTITPEDLNGLRTINQLQRLAKHKYYTLAQQYHPDARASRLRASPRLRPFTGTTFQLITKTYRWLMALPSAALLPRPRVLTLRHETPPIYDAGWPSALERRPLTLPYGWQEDTTRYWYA